MSAILEEVAPSQEALPACLWIENPNGLVSMLDMVRYAVRDLHTLLLWIDHFVSWTYSQEKVAYALSSSEGKTVMDRMSCVRKHFIQMEMNDAISACDGLTSKIDSSMSIGECRGRLLIVRNLLTETLSNRFFMYVPVHRIKYAKTATHPSMTLPNPPQLGLKIGVDKITLLAPPAIQYPDGASMPLGEAVYNAFVDARYDAQEFSLCVVAGAWTAAVFHLMRVVEWGVRSLGKEMGVQRIKEVTKPSKHPAVISGSSKPSSRKQVKFKLKPIENCTWDAIQSHLRTKMDKRLSQLRVGPARDAKMSFYATLFHEFNGFKDAWRNHVMHTREQYREDTALPVLPHVQRFMNEIATRLK